MPNVKINIADNLIRFRTKAGLTQAELAERLHYSDKAVSKWERAESMPDIQVLTEIAELFGVTLDDLVKPASETVQPAAPQTQSLKHRNHILITAICVVLVWLIGTVAFVTLQWIPSIETETWLAYLCSAPISLIVWLVFNSIWFNRRRNFLIISLLMWTTLVAIFLSLLLYKTNVWLLFVIGIPAQIIILLWSGIIRIKHK